MRLIDADELKEDLKQFYPEEVLNGVTAKATFNQILHDIDNTPTVKPESEVFEWCTDCKEYDQENHCCHRWSSKIRETVEELKQERPTGHWVWTSCNPYDEHIGRWSCSICNYEPDGKLIDEDVYYCPNCGARMEGET